VVFPYLELGQSSSGPIPLALELSCSIIASRTHIFLQFARYNKDMIEFFDIDNHLEQAGGLRARAQYDPGIRVPSFNVKPTARSISPPMATRPSRRGRWSGD
jgi:hypothetical protein